MKKYLSCLFILSAILFYFVNCKHSQPIEIHPLNDILSYNLDLNKINLPIEKRILPAPEIIISFLNEFDNVDNYASHELSDDERLLFMDYYDLLPETFKNIINEKVAGIYFIENFLGGGMTMPAFESNMNMYMVLFLNPEILNTNITEWINYRDNSIFMDNKNEITLTVECNTNHYALLTTLVHEACHIYDYYSFVTPYTDKIVMNVQNTQNNYPTSFIQDIWLDYDRSIELYDYKNRRNVSFYDLGERTDKILSLELFTALSKTPFTSLYGAKNWAEDFAETFTWYYLKKYFDVDFITTLSDNENILIVYNPNENELVKRRYELFFEIK
ncbi:MAG: hypothetical protein FWG99_09465 [Treponema sp.]|nr:hypothetical protein [Treponema sp.]